MNDSLRTALKQLRLSGLLDSLEVRLQEAAGNGLTHAEFLEIIVQDELAVRGDRQLQRRVKAAQFRELKTLEHFSHIAKREGVRRTIAVATSAVRDAKNGPEFVKTVYKKTGIRVRIISGKEEGRLIFLGASSGLVASKDKKLIVDIGGGSAEFVLGDQRRIDMDESLPLGVARLKDRFLKKNPPSKDNIRNLEEAIEDKISDVLKQTEHKKYMIQS